MHDPIRTPTGEPRSALLLAIVLMSIAPASSVVRASDASPGLIAPSASPPPAAEAIHGWPGTRGEPAGLYSWSVGGRGWMHKVPEGWREDAPNSVEIVFDTLDGYGQPPAESIAVAGADLGGAYPAVPERVADERLQTWRLDVDDAQVVIIVRSFPDTDPALVAEAEAVVDSVRVDRTGALTPRLVFRLLEGWDSG